MSLTDKQAAFIEEYLVDFNATRAAERAGYAGNESTLASVGYENLRKPHIAARVKERLRETAMTATEIQMRLSEQARGAYADYITPEGGVNVAQMVADGKAHLIKRMKDTKFVMDIEFYDAQRALQMLGKAHGMFKDRVDSYDIDLDKLTDEQLRRIADGEDPIYVLATSSPSEAGA